MLTKRIDGVQKQVEGRNFDVRKHILEYDDVLNQHRLVIYGRRNKILEKGDIHEDIINIVRDQAGAFVE
jgi:preprotein translocase subunit SecA